VPTILTTLTDALAQKRVENTDRNFRRISTKFHTYAAALQDQQKRRSGVDPGYPSASTPLDDLRQALRQELDAFLLSIQKSELVVQAEQMQAQEYHDNRTRILDEHDSIRFEIENLREELQEAELQKERKKEYDVIAARVNNLPQRSELNACVQV
ncbi:THO complex subunit 7/Mft1, partial [Cantharellus anzutake]|uniref:THO complex subunit 7/Mft1 n=1 Tax=Cantharellus anzutake TaxID=1750568 RepID=UPI001907C491